MKKSKWSVARLLLATLSGALLAIGGLLLKLAIYFAQIDFNDEGRYWDQDLGVVLHEQSIAAYFLLSGAFIIPGLILGFLLVRKFFISNKGDENEY